MNLKLRYRDIGLLLIFLYPLADMTYNTFSNKTHYSTFSIIFFLVYILFTLISEKYLVTNKLLILVSAAIIWGLLFYAKSGSVLIQFFIFLLLLYFFSSKRYLNKIDNYIRSHMKMIQLVITGYALLLMYSITFLDGIQKNWNTFVVYGPYSLPHILAYEMLVLLMISFICYKTSREKRWLFIALFYEIMIILTCVRTAVLASAIIIFIFTTWFGFQRKIYLLILGGISIVVLSYYGVFNQILEKTVLAINNGSVTNGRSWIASSTLKIFEQSSFLEMILGSGYINLLEGNAYNLGTAVQGHNDFLTVLVSFGFIGLLMYCLFFAFYLKGKGWFACVTCLFIMLFFNGLFLYMPMVIGLGIVRNYFAERNEVSIRNEHGNIVTG